MQRRVPSNYFIFLLHRKRYKKFDIVLKFVKIGRNFGKIMQMSLNSRIIKQYFYQCCFLIVKGGGDIHNNKILFAIIK